MPALRSGEPVVGALTITGENGQHIAYRCYGAVFHHDPEGTATRIFLRLVRREVGLKPFSALNARIRELTAEIRHRKGVEARLWEQTEWLRVTLKSIRDAVITTDPVGGVTFLNQAAQEFTGWAEAEALGRPLEEVFRIIDEKTGLPIENPAAKALREGAAVGLANHTRLVARDGTQRRIDDCAAPIQNERGAIGGVVLVVRDVTERQRAEDLLVEQNRVLEMIIEGAALPEILDALCRIVEVQAHEPLLVSILLKDDEDACLRPIAGSRVLQDGHAVVVRVPIGAGDALGDGHGDEARRHGFRAGWSTPILSAQDQVLGSFDVYSPGACFPDPGDTHLVDLIARTAGIAIERRRAVEALQESERRFRQLADAMPQIVWAARPDGFVDYYNRRWYEFSNQPEGLEGDESWMPVVHPDDLRGCADSWYRSVRSCALLQIESRLREHRTGAYRWHLVRALPVKDSSGRVVRWYGTSTDIHDQKQAEEALRESDRRKTEFLATLAHELRNPLAPIRNGLYLMKLATGTTRGSSRPAA